MDARNSPPMFILDSAIPQGDIVELTGDAYKRSRALRLLPQEPVRLAAGDIRYEGLVSEVRAGRVVIQVTRSFKAESPHVKVHLYPALLKGRSLDLVVEKATELGVSSLTPILSRRTIPKIDKDGAGLQISRWRRVAKAAAEQSGRGETPHIVEPIPFDLAVAQRTKGVALIAHERGVGRASIFSAVAGKDEASILIGPEGGFDQEEVEEALSAGFVPVSLGPYVLRAETASIAAAAILMAVLEPKRPT